MSSRSLLRRGGQATSLPHAKTCSPWWGRLVACQLLVAGLASATYSWAQSPVQPAAQPTPQKPGVPGVQHPMMRVVPDAEYAIDGNPDWLAAGEDSVWVNSKPTDFVFRMEPSTNRVVAKVPVTKPCSGLVVAAGALWSPSCEENVIYRIDLATNKTVAKIPVGPANTEGGLTFGAGSVWMPSDPAGVVSRIDPATNSVAARIKVAPGSFTAVFGYGLVWVSSTEKHLVSVIHPASNKVIAEIPVDKTPRFMTAGEGYVWTLNQTNGTVTKIDPATMKVAATIDVGLPGTGGDISAAEGAVWITARTIPLTRIDPATNQVTAQFVGPGGDGLRVLHGSVWLSNGRWKNVWRIRASKLASPASWMTKAQPIDLTADGAPDVLLEDLDVWFPGDPVAFRMKLLNPSLDGRLVLKTTLNGATAETQFRKTGDEWVASFTGKEPRWIHYSVCIAGTGACSSENVTASPTTSLAYARKTTRFVPDTFLPPGPPQIGSYVWNILEPAILSPDYQALLDRASPSKMTKMEDYGELKRHRWEFENGTAFSYGILTPDKTLELGCVYINPSRQEGYDAMVRLWVTKQGAEAGLELELEKAVRQWVRDKWPFAKVAYPGRSD